MTGVPKDNLPTLGTPRTRLRPLPYLLGAVTGGFLLAFLIVPIFLTIAGGFYDGGRLTGFWFVRIARDPIVREQAANGLLLACATTGLSLLLGVPPALLRARTNFRGLATLSLFMLVPMILPPFVGALSVKHLFSQFGTVNLLLERIGLLDFSTSRPPDWLGGGFAGVVVLQSLHLFPILYLNASAALANVDPAYGQAARNLGASPLRTFFRITLPLIRPGLFAGGTIVFIWSLTDIGTPLIIGYNDLIPVTIFKELARAATGPRTYSLVFVLLSGSITLYVLGKFLFGRPIAADSSKASVGVEIHRLSLVGTLGAWVLFGSVIALALLPHIGVVLTAISARWVNSVLPTEYTMRHLMFVVTRPETYNSIFNSLKYAGLATVLDIILGSVAGWVIVRSQIRGRNILDGLAMLPLAVPGLILAAGYVALTAPGTYLESIGPMQNPLVILVIAYSVRRLPFVVRGVSAGLQQVPVSLEDAACNLGSSRLGAAVRITAPLIAANIIAASVLTFAFAMLEVSDSLILAQKQIHYPITKQIYTLARSGNPEAANVASALGVYGMGFLALTMMLSSALLGRRLGAIFRA